MQFFLRCSLRCETKKLFFLNWKFNLNEDLIMSVNEFLHGAIVRLNGW
jgi:hypothetical protein